jgi:hypothetical protein
VKQGFRFDNSNKPNSPWGENGRAHHNVAWNVARQFIKGDKHFVHNDLCFDCAMNDLSVSSNMAIQGRNFSTITRKMHILAPGSHRIGEIKSVELLGHDEPIQREHHPTVSGWSSRRRSHAILPTA